jgi:hypothetical protein
MTADFYSIFCLETYTRFISTLNHNSTVKELSGVIVINSTVSLIDAVEAPRPIIVATFV